MFTIGEAAKATGLDKHTLRYYEKIGLIPKPARTANRYRLYGEKDLETLDFLKKGKALGLSLSELSHILDLKQKGERPCPPVIKLLQDKLKSLNEQIELLLKFRKALEEHVNALPEGGIDGKICGCIESHQIFVEKTKINRTNPVEP